VMTKVKLRIIADVVFFFTVVFTDLFSTF
jgi:hypothetical protein